jgi:hypothetical protein
VYLHYCMGKQVGFSFSPDESEKCPRCGMKNTDRDTGCCKDEQKVIKSEKNQKLTDLTYLSSLQKKFITVSASFRPYIVNAGYFNLICKSAAHDPPWARTVPVHIMNCLLLI